MNVKSTSLITKINQKVKKFLLSFVCYYNGEFNRIDLAKNGEVSLIPIDKKKSYQILIVSRAFYREKTNQYPIESQSELKKILKLEFTDSPNTKYHCCGVFNGKSLVNVWVFDDEVPSAWFTFPESLLFAKHIEENQVLMVATKKPIFISLFNEGVTSVSQSVVINSAQRFALSVGINSVESEKQIEHHQIPEKLVTSFKLFSLPLFFSFMQPMSNMFNTKQLKRIVIPVICLYFLNLFLTSIYLSYQENRLTNEMAENSAEISVLLDEQSKNDLLMGRYTVLSQFMETQLVHTPLLISLAKIYPTVRFSNIRVDAGRYVLRGYTDNALSLLTMMNKQPEIEDVKFDFPINKGGTQEFFVISFKLIKADASFDTNVVASNNQVIFTKESNHG